MEQPTETQVIRSLIVQHNDGLSPKIRVSILERFLKCRQTTARRTEVTVPLPLINVTTYTSYDADGIKICEDVVCKTREVRFIP